MYMVHYINKGKNLETEPVDLSNKNKCMAYCSKLSFGILSCSTYVDLEKNENCFFCCRKK